MKNQLIHDDWSLEDSTTEEVSKLLESAEERKMETGKSRYPKSVFFIVGNEFCERFCYYGMRAILVLYLTDWLRFTDDAATAIFHAWTFLCYFTPVFGAMMADGYVGKYKTILILSSVYCLGSVVLSLTAFPPPFWLGPMVGLLLISIGTGGIKPCVSAFGGDQFASDQKKEQKQFFSVFYFSINLGSLFSMIVTPAIRGHVTCFDTSCFSLAFAVPAILMVVAIALFMAGSPMYKRNPPTGNVIGRSLCCVGRALKNRCQSGFVRRDHWLEYADDKYDPRFIEDLKQVMRILFMYIPLPVFWALFDQIGSRWLLQAKQMNGRIGDFVFIPDWMPAFNALFIILFIPLTEYIVYPLFAKCNLLTRAIQRMVAGMTLAGVAFIMAGILQTKIDAALDVRPPPGQVDLRIINAAPCAVLSNIELFMDTIPVAHASDILHPQPREYTGSFSLPANGCSLANSSQISVSVPFREGFGYHLVLAIHNRQLQAKAFAYDLAHGVDLEDRTSREPGVAFVNIIYACEQTPATVYLVNTDSPLLEGQMMHHEYTFNQSLSSSVFHRVFPATYHVSVDVGNGGNETTSLPNTLTVKTNGYYTLVIQPNVSHPEQPEMVDYSDVPPESIHIMWQIPQYIVLTFAEILFSISGLEFSYSQAPQSMKSTMQASWLLTDAIGNLLVVIIAAAQVVHSQTGEFMLFAGLSLASALIFAIMGYFYRYVDSGTVVYEHHTDENDDENTLVAAVHEAGPEDETETTMVSDKQATYGSHE